MQCELIVVDAPLTSDMQTEVSVISAGIAGNDA